MFFIGFFDFIRIENGLLVMGFMFFFFLMDRKCFLVFLGIKEMLIVLGCGLGCSFNDLFIFLLGCFNVVIRFLMFLGILKLRL